MVRKITVLFIASFLKRGILWLPLESATYYLLPITFCTGELVEISSDYRTLQLVLLPLPIHIREILKIVSYFRPEK